MSAIPHSPRRELPVQKNFGLIGVYILEPAEPLPPLSREDLEFEQLQTVYIFRLREVLNCITERRKLEKIPGISGRYPFPLRVFKTPCEF